jgi:prolyl oligopeptidase
MELAIMLADARPTVASPDDDPYLWLEEIDGERALAWVGEQNSATLAAFGGIGFAHDRDTLAAILDRPDNIPFVTRRGAYLYNFWRDAKNPRGLWRRTTLDSFRTEQPDWEIILDLDALAEQEKEDWLWAQPASLPGTHDRAILSLSRGGGDAVALREFDIPARAFVADGFVLPQAKSWVDWLDEDTLLLSSAYGEDMATKSGYPRTVRLWRRGEKVERTPVLFQSTRDTVHVSANVDRTHAGRVWFIDTPAFFEAIIWLGDRTGPKARLDLPSDVQMSAHGDWMAVKRRAAWTIGERTYPPDTLLGIPLAAFVAGDRNFTVLFEPGERRAPQHFFWSDGRLVLSILDELRPVFEVLTPSAEGWSRSSLPGLPAVGVVSVGCLDTEEAESNGDLLANVQDPLTPSSMLLIERGKAPALIKRAPQTFSPDGLVITRHEARSIDGERIPYVQVGPAAETGEAPVHMTGYGGFGISSLPYYSSSIGKLWLERGGTSVTANIRGGGEFGTWWHEAGRLARKALTHDDFAAVAADLVRRGVTRPGRIAAEGGSNGGLLITNMLTRYPERFGALFCAIPLVDMRRYSKLLAGASWIAEYGDPDKPGDWAFLKTFSAYHLARPGCSYPPILLATTRKDDRVHPGHARKMAAKLQALGYEAYFYEPAAGGHSSGKDNKESAAFIALGHAFLREKIRWSPNGQ